MPVATLPAPNHRPPSSPALLTPLQWRAVVAGAAGLHLLAGWGLLQIDAVRSSVVEAVPLFVSMVAPEPPAPPPPPPALKTKTPPPPAPLIAAAPVQNTPSAFVAEPPPPLVVAAPAPAMPPAPPASPAPPAPPKLIPAGAVQYLVPPQLEYPRASRRQRESGKAVVRVFIDVAGVPQVMQLSQSTGFALLDEAALNAVRKARFKPYTENGQPTAGWALVPLSFDLEK